MQGTNENAAIRRLDRQLQRRRNAYREGQKAGQQGLKAPNARELQDRLGLRNEEVIEYLNGLLDGRTERSFVKLPYPVDWSTR